jgi:hypothetical protein
MLLGAQFCPGKFVGSLCGHEAGLATQLTAAFASAGTKATAAVKTKTNPSAIARMDFILICILEEFIFFLFLFGCVVTS